MQSIEKQVGQLFKDGVEQAKAAVTDVIKKARAGIKKEEDWIKGEEKAFEKGIEQGLEKVLAANKKDVVQKATR